MEKDKLPPPWFRQRDEEELERERKHLAMMRKFEAQAELAGIRIRLRKPKQEKHP